jgi:hypothetical protein
MEAFSPVDDEYVSEFQDDISATGLITYEQKTV